MTQREPRLLADELTDAFRVVFAGAVAMAVVLVSTAIWFLVAGDPASAQASRAVVLSNDLHVDLLNEVSAVRAYLVTGDRVVLASVLASRAKTLADAESLESAAESLPRSAAAGLSGSESQWQEGWVAKALDPASRLALRDRNGGLDTARLAVLVQSGRASFVKAQAAAQRVLAAATRKQSSARRDDVIAIVSSAVVLVGIGVTVGVGSIHRRRRLQHRIAEPIATLLDKLRAIGRGEFGVSVEIDAPVELLDLREELVDMSGSLRLQQQALAQRAEAAAASARRLKLVVNFAREVSESLTLTHMLAVATSAARRVADAPRSRVWLLDDGARTLTLRHDSITGEKVRPMTRAVGYGALGRAAQTRRATLADGLVGDEDATGPRATALAVPMIKGARLIGVLEILLPVGVSEPRPELVEILEAMAAQAAVAIDAALTYALAESLSLSDPLTGLANRRQLTQDLALEVERAARYHRPLAFLMVDIDRFKAVNDTFGHAVGDAVLVEVAGIFGEKMRSGDTVYRYGGEEFAVLTRETDIEGARLLAERLRQAIEDRYATKVENDLSVTISVGIADLAPGAPDAAQIVADADEALYAAKRSGRNRVEVADRPLRGVPFPRVRLTS
jgi:diguanylate cyclase (GGDEF)-like protein